MKFLQIIILLKLSVFNLAVIMEGPQFLQEPPHWLDFTNSTGAIIDCKATGVPQPTISWLDAIDNRVTDIPGLREVLANGSLRLLPFGSMQSRNDIHSTTYRCLATNPVGSILSRECKLRPEMLSDYQSTVENEYTVEGNVGVLKCRIRGAPSRIRVVNWLRQDSVNAPRRVINVGPKYTMTRSGALHIAHTTLNDAQAIFYCQTVHPLTGQRKLSSAGKVFLAADAEKNSAPRIEHSTTNTYARVGEAADLICTAYGTPPPVYRWYKEVNSVLEEVRRGSLLIKSFDSILRFSRVQRQDSGHYVCVVNNALGEDRKKLTLVVHSPLSVTVRPHIQTVDGGNEAQLNCSVEGGNGGHNVGWLKNGQSIHDDPRYRLLKNSEVLLIQNVQKEDGGMYQCLARTSDETEQSTAQIRLGAMPPELKTTFIEQTIQPGSSVSLICQASGSPLPRISWYLDGSPIVPDESYMPFSYIDTTGDVISYLNITRTKVYHGGFYSCLAENSLGIVAHSESLNVFGPPTPRRPLNITAVYGGDKILQCPIAGYPVTTTSWLSRGETLSNKHQVYKNGSLLLRNLDDSEDGGEYTCTVRNQQGQVARNFVFLRIMHPPKIQEFHFPSNLQEGNRAHVSCTVISGDLPIEIIWLKDGHPMPHEPDVQEKNHQFVSGLLFSNLANRHSGHYTCVARNAAAQTNFTSRLIVKVAPSWRIEPKDTSVLYQHTILIHCQADGYPSPRITWSKSKGPLSTTSLPIEPGQPNLEFASNGTLVIHSATLQHKGHFTCEVDNGIGNPLRKTIFLMVNVPAYFRSHHINLSGVVGDSLKLICEAEGDLPLDIKWVETPRDQPMPAPHVRYTPTGLASELELHNIIPEDAGKYQCQVDNDYGSDSMMIHVSISEAPEAPKKVEVYDIGSRWVNVRWLAPESAGSPITHFVVQFREQHSETVWSNLTVTGTTFSARLGTLLPSVDYELHVLAVNKVGMGPRSAIITFKTQQEAPAFAPTGVVVEATEAETLLVKWKPVNDVTGEVKDVSGYQVTYKEMSSPHRSVKTVRGQFKHQTKISGLKQWTKYEITVRAFNHIGNGPESKVAVVTTLEGYPGAAPLNIRCEGMSARTLKVTWEPPPLKSHNGHLRGYNLLFKRIDNSRRKGIVGVEIKKTNNLEEFIHGLLPHTNYSIRIAAYTSAGDGIESDSHYCSTDEDVPGPPEQIKAMVTSSGSVLISWTHPMEPNGNIIKYNIYIQTNNDELITETLFGSKSLKYECRKLKEHQNYDFWVTASTKVGEGSKSQVVSAIPLARAPARIASFSSKIFSGEGSVLSLQCNAVGLPAPGKLWRDPEGHEFSEPKENFKDVGNSRKILSDNTLIINPVRPQHAGNYTCFANNVFGIDNIVYQVVVVSAPKSPEVAIMDITTKTIDIQWKVSAEDEPFLTEFLLHFRGPDEEWSRVSLDADQTHHRLKKLKCGTMYVIAIQGVNEVGKSDNSNMIEVRTKGGLPPGAPINDFLLVNSTSVTLFLDSWPINGCPILYFVISYKSAHQSYWTSISEKIPPSDDFQINELLPATRYTIHLTVVTDAGVYKHEYAFTTRNINGDIVPDDSSSNTSSSILSDNMVAPLASAMICATLVFGCLTLYVKRRYFCRSNSSSKALMELENKRNDHQQGSHAYSPSPGRKDQSSLSVNKGSDASEICTTFSADQMISETTFNGRGIQTFLSRESYPDRERNVELGNPQGGSTYDIYPYATFSLPGQAATHSLRLKTFSQHGCYSGVPPPKEPQLTSKHRSKATSKSPPDGLSLEISCISSQQTLPIERKKSRDGPEVLGLRRGATSTFISDSESSGDRPFRVHQTPHKHRTETTLMELDSSTESAEMSPEIGWRSVMGRSIPSR